MLQTVVTPYVAERGLFCKPVCGISGSRHCARGAPGLLTGNECFSADFTENTGEGCPAPKAHGQSRDRVQMDSERSRRQRSRDTHHVDTVRWQHGTAPPRLPWKAEALCVCGKESSPGLRHAVGATVPLAVSTLGPGASRRHPVGAADRCTGRKGTGPSPVLGCRCPGPRRRRRAGLGWWL